MEEKLKVEDKSRISNIIFHHPQLMNDKAISIIEEKYSRLKNLDESIHRLRYELITLEEQYASAKKEWDSLKILFDYSHPYTEKEAIKGSCDIAIKGHGNDIIGRTTII